ITIGRLGGRPDDETLQLKGKLFFANGIPVAAPYDGGAQVLIEDLGSGGATVFELSEANTDALPPASAGTCAVAPAPLRRPPATTANTAARPPCSPPACTAGTARGFFQLQYRPRSSRDLDVLVKVKKGSIGAIVGPLRATVVMGATQADGDAGRCAVSAAVA